MGHQNQVALAGKVSKIKEPKYTPSGACIREVVLAVSQSQLEKPSVGYFEVLFTGDLAQQGLTGLKIGDSIEVSGTLWNRTYRNRDGVSVNETKVMAVTLKQVEQGLTK